MASTSGTVSTYAWDNRRLIDHASRRAGLIPNKLGAEELEVAIDLLYSITSEWVNAGVPLWTITRNVLGAPIGQPEIALPAGTVNAQSVYWRQLNPYRGAALTSGGADASGLFTGAVTTDITVAQPNPGVYVDFTSSTEVDTIGVLLGGAVTFTGTANVQTSSDGVTWTTAQSLASTTYSPGAWQYFDLSPSVASQYLRLQFPGSTNITLQQLNFGLANSINVLMAPLSEEDYFQLPNQYFQSDRAVEYWVDRQNPNPFLRIWPVANSGAFYNGALFAVCRRYIQDPGTLTNILDAPQRWTEAAIARLATKLIRELPQPETQNQGNPYAALSMQQKITDLDSQATKSEALAWGEERTKSPLRMAPVISGYTA